MEDAPFFYKYFINYYIFIKIFHFSFLFKLLVYNEDTKFWRGHMLSYLVAVTSMGLSAGLMFVVLAAVYILFAIPAYMMFRKAGEEGWKAFIPFYNDYTMANLVWETKVFWIMLVLSLIMNIADADMFADSVIISLIAFIASIAYIVYNARFCKRISNAYGHGLGFAIGLLFLPFIFEIIIGFGSSQYLGKRNYY